jgi:hypothetical protein
MNTKTTIFLSTLAGCAFLLLGWDTDGRYLQQALLVLGGAVLSVVATLLEDEEERS